MMKTWIWCAVAALVCSASGNAFAEESAKEESAKEIARKARDHGALNLRDLTAELKLSTTKNGVTKEQVLRTTAKELDGRAHSLAKFLSPAGVAGVTVLTIEGGENQPDDISIYLPKLRRVRKVAKTQRGQSFMDTDFNYADLGGTGTEDENVKRLADTRVEGRDVYVLQGEGDESSPYGEVTLYGDVGSKGLNRAGTRMIKPNATWKNATQISAGRFGGTRYVTDLIVRWADGGLTLYTNVGAGTFGQQHRLKAPNGTWKNATLLTGGDFSGRQKWDLMVRWADGELDDYPGTGTSGLGTERRIQNPNGRWAQVATMTTGDFTENGRTDDLVVRRSDGETTMYTDTSGSSLGRERMLVAPTS